MQVQLRPYRSTGQISYNMGYTKMSRTPFAMRIFPNSSLSVERFIKHQTILSSVSAEPSQVDRVLSLSAIHGIQPVDMMALASSNVPAEILTRTQLALSYHQLSMHYDKLLGFPGPLF